MKRNQSCAQTPVHGVFVDPVNFFYISTGENTPKKMLNATR